MGWIHYLGDDRTAETIIKCRYFRCRPETTVKKRGKYTLPGMYFGWEKRVKEGSKVTRSTFKN